MPTVSLTGKVLFANNQPAPNVKVRVFDGDIGSGDDDLTVSEGLTNASGDFTVQYDPGRFQDYLSTTKAVWEMTGRPTWSNPTGTWGWVNHTFSVPDPTDIYAPYLTFAYSISGMARTQRATLLPFQKQFTLPDFGGAITPFLPSVHGFKFNNNFPGYPLPFTVSGLPSLPLVPGAYGLCGGMDTVAADFYWASRPIPNMTTVPAQGSALQQYIYQRQIDSFGGGGIFIKKFADWMVLPDSTPLGTMRRTADEFAQLRAQIDAHKLVVLGLVYKSLPALLWENHQVLAYAYQQTSSNTFRISIYDPNYHGQDDIRIEAQLVAVGAQVRPGDIRTFPPIPPKIETVMGLQCTQHNGTSSTVPVRGFFVMPYQAVTPPAGI